LYRKIQLAETLLQKVI